jgi:hypothetical protein
MLSRRENVQFSGKVRDQQDPHGNRGLGIHHISQSYPDEHALNTTHETTKWPLDLLLPGLHAN